MLRLDAYSSLVSYLCLQYKFLLPPHLPTIITDMAWRRLIRFEAKEDGKVRLLSPSEPVSVLKIVIRPVQVYCGEPEQDGDVGLLHHGGARLTARVLEGSPFSASAKLSSRVRLLPLSHSVFTPD